MIIVSLVILVFLWHVPSAIVPIVTIPVSVLLAFIPMRLLGISVNIMSLAGIAISIGVLVDGAIVEMENAYNKLHRWHTEGRPGDFHAVRLAALQEVGPSVFFSLLVIAVAFLPIFALVDQEGRLFNPCLLEEPHHGDRGSHHPLDPHEMRYARRPYSSSPVARFGPVAGPDYRAEEAIASPCRVRFYGRPAGRAAAPGKVVVGAALLCALQPRYFPAPSSPPLQEVRSSTSDDAAGISV